VVIMVPNHRFQRTARSQTVIAVTG
jgi:hypothetical protein